MIYVLCLCLLTMTSGNDVFKVKLCINCGPKPYTDACDPNPCENGSTCSIDGWGKAQCQCPKGYTGPRCETEIDPCYSNPCKHGGSCYRNVWGIKCICPHPYTGVVCETVMTPCDPNPCLNGGSCFHGSNWNKICMCPNGYIGDECEIEDPCNQIVCQNGGTCTDGICVCPTGTTGPMCDVDTDNLLKTTPVGFTGAMCGTVVTVDVCDPNPCQNGGTCQSIGAIFMCNCPTGTTGITCEM